MTLSLLTTTETTTSPLYFASGSSRPADIRGFAAIGHAIGVAAPEVSPNAAQEGAREARRHRRSDLRRLGSLLRGQVRRRGRPRRQAPRRRRLAPHPRALHTPRPRPRPPAPRRRSRPHRRPEETLARLSRYAPALRALRALGVNVLVPIQKGYRSQVAFVRDVERVLGFTDFVHAIPSKKKATTTAEVRAYLSAVRPARVHFLGLGLKNKRTPGILKLVREFVPGAAVSLDSNMIAANVGRGKVGKNGKVSKTRRLTVARDEASALIASGASWIANVQELGIILAFGTESDRARAMRQAVAA